MEVMNHVKYLLMNLYAADGSHQPPKIPSDEPFMQQMEAINHLKYLLMNPFAVGGSDQPSKIPSDKPICS